MISNSYLHSALSETELRALIKRGIITLGGNKKLKIFGTLHCKSGKRMLQQNRVFFSSVYKAKQLGYRPCGHCMNEEYKNGNCTMNLFDTEENPNLLPYDGEVIYHGHILAEAEAKKYYEALLNDIAWQHDEAVIYGKRIVTKRKVAWYGDDTYDYTYSRTTKTALSWTKELLELKDLVEKTCGTKFNSCLLNLYHDGTEGMAWHSDDEKSLGKNTVISSLSLGAVRKFSFRHKKTGEKIETVLDNGSLLVMKGETQTNWLHMLPKSVKIKHPRINLTFRTIVKSTS